MSKSKEKLALSKEAFRPREFCRCYGISKSTFYLLVARGIIRVVKSGRMTLVPRAEADAWLASLTETQPARPKGKRA